MSKHKITTTHDDVELLITFNWIKGAPEQGPSYSSGGQPADPDEIELIMVISRGGPDCSWIEWATNWLQGEGFAEAMEIVDSDLEAAYEQAMEMRRG